MSYRILILLFFITCFCRGISAQLVKQDDDELQKITVEEHLGEVIPLELSFLNTRGDTVVLSDSFRRGMPVLLSLYYTNCPMLCSLLLTGLAKGVRGMDLIPGKDFQMLSISFDPRETPQSAAAVKARYQGMLKPDTPADGWEFLISPDDQTRTLAQALGFSYFYIAERNEYAHPAVVFILTDGGVISRYLYGIEFNPRDLRLSLVEASQGKIGTTMDRVLLYCFHYDPEAKGYVAVAGNIMKLGGLATVLLLGAFLAILWGRDRISRNKRAKTS
jgi:protein SCO1/2